MFHSVLSEETWEEEAVSIVMPDFDSATIRRYFGHMFTNQGWEQHQEVGACFGSLGLDIPSKISKVEPEIIVKEEEDSEDGISGKEDNLSDIGDYERDDFEGDDLDTDFVKLETKSSSQWSGEKRVDKEKFTCPQCRKVVSCKRKSEHLKICKGPKSEEPYKCKICDKAFSSKYNIKRHYENVHEENNQDKAYNCTLCDYKTNRKDGLKEHFEWHHGGSLTCDICRRTFNTTGKLKLHMERIHGSDAERNTDKYTVTYSDADGKLGFKCNVCNQELSSKQNAINHYEALHVRKNEVDEPKPCELCGIVLEDARSFQSHMTRVHGKIRNKTILQGKTLCTTCKKYVKTEKFEKHVCQQDQECKQCGKMFFSRNDRDRHIREEHEIEMYSCDQCGKTFTSQSLVKIHMRVHVEKSECPHCGIKVKHLQAHIEKAHIADDLKRFKCHYCGKGFINNRLLQKHVDCIHLNARRYQCRYGCDFRFNDSSNRAAHERKKHGATAEQTHITNNV